MIKVKFIRDFKACYQEGDTRSVQPHFAKVLIDEGFAKAVDAPQKHKMVERPGEKK